LTDLLRWREEFPALRDQVYLVTASMGAGPRRGAERLAAYADAWTGTRLIEYEDLDQQIGDKVAKVIGGEPDTVSFFTNSTDAAAVALSCFDFKGKRNKLIYTDQNFPSIPYLCKQQERLGARVQVVPSRDGVGVDLDELLAAIDEETLMLPISHVFFRSGFVQDVPAIVRKAHSVGASVLLDVYQSAGILPVKAAEWGVDFIVGGTLKWLCGGPGAGFLYVRPDLAPKLTPRITGWLAHARPMEFAMDDYELAQGAARFRTGVTNLPALFACEPGLDIILEIGVDRIREHSLSLSDYATAKAERRGLRVYTPADHARRGGAVSMSVPEAEEIAEGLGERSIRVNLRPPAGIRISLHFYNTREDVDAYFAAVDELAAARV
jgi:kynureninase